MGKFKHITQAENVELKREENECKDINLEEAATVYVFTFGLQRLHDSRGLGWKDKSAKIWGNLRNGCTPLHELRVMYFAQYAHVH